SAQILQSQKIAFEVALIVQINVEAEKVDILRQQIVGRRISRVGKKNVRINRASDAHQIFDELSDTAHAEPAGHRARDLVADEITKHGRIANVTTHRAANRSRDFIAHFFVAQK